MTRVAFVTNDWAHDPLTGVDVPNGSGFYRAFLPMTCLDDAMMGKPRFSPKQGIGIDDGRYGQFGFDVVFVKLIMDKTFLKWVERAKELGQRIVVDVDDYYEGLHPDNIALVHSDPDENTASNRDWMERIILAADTITVSTPFLHEVYSGRHRDVRMVRNTVMPEMFPVRQQERKPVVGWMGAVPWRSGDLETMTAWLPKFIEDNDLIFHHSGHIPLFPAAYERIGLPIDRCSVHPMVPMNRLGKLMCFDIGVVPLSDLPFNHAKSYLKGLEYAASGIPFVAQNLPEYRLLAQEKVGIAAEGPQEWLEAMSGLLGRKERVEVAEAALEAVRAGHTPANSAVQWQEAICDV